jgi:hypothetical protein
MKQRLLALAAAAAAAVAGSILFIDWDTGQPVTESRPGVFEFLDRDQCELGAACTATRCVEANNHWIDGGSGCRARLASCEVRVGAHARAWAADAGMALGPGLYQNLRFLGALCPARDGGQNFAVPMGGDGLPQFTSIAAVTPRCVRAPADGGQLCRRSERDGGFRYFGAGNVFPVSESNGHASCEPCGCVVMSGDKDTDL